MTRVLLAIGCNTYDHIRSLANAESDAERVHHVLCGNEKYSYDTRSSRLLRSPSTKEITVSLVELFEARPTDVLIYFAGHSESRDGRLYLKIRDTQDNVLPFTAIAFGELVDKIAQLPSLERLNVILDSCNAGGMFSDIAGFLGDRAKLSLGNASVAILAASDAAGPARENSTGGYLTTELVRALDGSAVVQRWSPFLELSQVNDFVQLTSRVRNQNPSYWGINVRGPNPLCHNPCYDPALGAIALPETFFGSSVKLSDAQLSAIRTFLSRVAADGYSPSLLRPVSESLSTLSTNEQITIFLGLAETLRTAPQELAGVIPPQDLLMLVQAILPLAEDKSARQILAFHSRRLPKLLLEQLLRLNSELSLDPMYFLKSRKASVWSSLYFTPIDLLDTLGWVGFCATFCDELSVEEHNELRRLVGSLIRNYGRNLVSIDDRQAPALMIFYIGGRILGWEEEVEDVLSLMFHDVWTTGGRVARSDVSAAEKLQFIIGRHNPLEDLDEILQSPSDLIGVLLICGAISGLDEFWDPLLFYLDRITINLFISNRYASFGDERISDGENVSLRVGQEFWSLFDLRHLTRSLLEKWPGSDEELAMEAVAISLFLGDRFPIPLLFGFLVDGRLRMMVPWTRVAVLNPATGRREEVLFEKGQRAQLNDTDNSAAAPSVANP